MLGAGGDTMTPKWTRPSMWIRSRSYPFNTSSFQFQPRAGDWGEWEKRGLHLHLRAPAPVGYMDYLAEIGSSSESFSSPNISESCPVIHLCLYLCYIYSGETFVCTVI